jgi:hypothetical protein
MMPSADLRSLNYIAETLQQISTMLRDFDLDDTAKLLDAARQDLETKIPKKKGEEPKRI